MKIAVIGSGAMGRTTIMDLSECPEVKKILVADYQEKTAKEFASSFKDPRIKGSFVDANEIDKTADLIKGYDAVCNTAQYYVNLHVMKACLKAGCHYNDIGGLYHTTLKQLELFNDFKKAGLTAVLGMGAAPGITNVLAAYAYNQLDEVEIVRLTAAGVDKTDMKGIDVFMPPYSIMTLMEEFSEESLQFINGEYKTLPPLSGKEEIVYPEPVGPCICIHTLHSEQATIPSSFKNKGVKEVTFKLGLPLGVRERIMFLASVGLGSKKPVKVGNMEVAPIEVLVQVLDKHIKEKLEGVKLNRNAAKCRRAQVIGKKNGRKVEYLVDCMAGIHSRWGVDCAVGVPPSIVAQMQAKGMIKEPGVWAPEQVIDPEYFFKELVKRELEIWVTTKEHLT
jgi:saccharopine dehydrogenase-like NADP-dependent oxidoreductase